MRQLISKSLLILSLVALSTITAEAQIGSLLNRAKRRAQQRVENKVEEKVDKAVTQAVAVIVPHEPRLAVHHGDGALVTGGVTGAAAVAFILINFNDSPLHRKTPLLLWFDYNRIK